MDLQHINQFQTTDLLAAFGTSNPENNVRLNSIKVPRITAGELYVSGPAWITGAIETPAVFTKGIKLAGDASSLIFADASGNSLASLSQTAGSFVLTNNNTTLSIGASSTGNGFTLQSSAGLSLQSGTDSIDFGGKKLVNYSGLLASSNDIYGPPNTVAVFDNDGQLDGISAIGAGIGGTGIDSRGLTGIAQLTNGVWNVAKLTITDLPAIPLGKLIAPANLPGILTSDNSGAITAIAALSPALGGTGINAAGQSGLAYVSNGTWQIGGAIPFSAFGNITALPLDTITPPSGTLAINGQTISQTAGNGAAKTILAAAAGLQPTLYELLTDTNTAYLFDIWVLGCSNVATSYYCCKISAINKSNVLTIDTTPSNSINSVDSSMAGWQVNISRSNNIFRITGTSPTATNWTTRIVLVQTNLP